MATGAQFQHKKKLRKNISLNQLKYASFLAGDFRLHQVTVKGKPVQVALRGSWKFSDQGFTALVQKTVQMERDFWQDYQFPYYLVTLMPLNSGCCHYAGTSLTNGVTLFLSPHQGLTANLKHLLTHEVFHTWNGRLIKRQKPEELVFWFSEGFTNYFARQMNLESGLISKAEYLRQVNQVWRDYYRSPARSADNHRVLGEFWSNKNVYNLPYLKGEILAHNWQALLKEQNTKWDLKMVMREFLQLARQKGTPVSAQLVQDVLGRYIPSMPEEIERFVNQGHLIRPYAKNLVDCGGLVQQVLKDSESHWGAASRYVKPMTVPQYQLGSCQ